MNVTIGDFAENIATHGVDCKSLPVGTRVKLGKSAVVEITPIGKECHNKCAIYYKAGDCIMPKDGIFAKVLSGGIIQVGDSVVVETPNKPFFLLFSHYFHKRFMVV